MAPSFLTHKNRLFYIGKASNGLQKRLRTHFCGKSSSADTFRRSVGSILREDLKLQPVKAGGKWKFDNDSETRLSEWIQENCKYNLLELDQNQERSLEIQLITTHTPPINIDCNPRALEELRVARSVCLRLSQRR